MFNHSSVMVATEMNILVYRGARSDFLMMNVLVRAAANLQRSV